MEDYLKVIYEIAKQTKTSEVRVKDIAKRLEVTRPSVVGMIKHLVEHELAVHHRYGGVELTSKGSRVAREMINRHRVLRRFLEEVLGLDAQVAEEDACRMEHSLSVETIDRFLALEEFRKSGPDMGELRGEAFRRFLRARRSPGRS